MPWAIFRSCLSQLIVSPAGGIVGISHDSLAFKFRVFGVPRDRESEVFEKFEFLESIYVEAVNASVAADASPSPSSARSRRASSR